MVKKKKLVAILPEPDLLNASESKSILSVSAGELEISKDSEETIYIVHHCGNGTDAFALTLDVCARLSELGQSFSIRLSNKTKEFVVRTANNDCIKLAFEDPPFRMNYRIENRIQAFRVAAFLFRELIRIGHANIFLVENVWKYFFVIEINSYSCITLRYNASAGEYGNLETLKAELDKIMSGADPETDLESLAVNEVLDVYYACQEIILPDDLSFLEDLDISKLKSKQQVYVTSRDSKPVQQTPPKDPLKKARKQWLRSVSQKKEVEKKTYNSFWDRVEMRGDRDD